MEQSGFTLLFINPMWKAIITSVSEPIEGRTVTVTFDVYNDQDRVSEQQEITDHPDSIETRILEILGQMRGVQNSILRIRIGQEIVLS